MKNFEVILGKNIKHNRLRKGLSQQDLAEKIGLEPTTISHLERGSTNPSLKTFIKLCNVLGVSTDVMLMGIIEEDTRGIDDSIKNVFDNLSVDESKIILRLLEYYTNNIKNEM